MALWLALMQVAYVAHGSKPQGGTQDPRSQALSVGHCSSLVHPMAGGGSVLTVINEGNYVMRMSRKTLGT